MGQPGHKSQEGIRRSFLVVAMAVFLLAWLRGFRFPNLWGATQFAFNYSQGFVRRGLVGEIARRLGGEHVFRYETFVLVSFAVFFATALALGLAIRRALYCDPRDWGLKIAGLVFGSSPALVFFIHAIGYNDYFGILLVLLVLLYSSQTARNYSIFYWVIFTTIISTLIHEGLAVMFGPILIFAMACHILRKAAQSPLTRRSWLLLLAHALVSSVAVLTLSSIISMIGVEDLNRVQALAKYVVDHADYPIRVEAFEALQRSSEENITRLMPWYWSVDDHWIGAKQSWQAFAPGFIWMLVYGCVAASRAQLLPSARWILGLLFLIASVAPLGFNFVGWDWGRWNGLALVASFCTILAMKMFFPSRREDSNPLLLLTTGLIATVIGLSSTTPLFDGFQVQPFPFQAHQDLVQQLLEDGFQYRPRG